MECIAGMLLEPEFSPVWSQYIGLLIPWDATHQILLDASYAGIGGWSPDFHIQWRVMRADLLKLGFKMKIIDRFAAEPLEPGSKGLHINPLEFIACIINLWLLIKLIQAAPPCLTGYIIDLWSDKTSALSWMRVAASTQDPHLQPLARLASTFFVIASNKLTHVQPCHIPGKMNIEANFLSCSKNGQVPSWERVIAQCSRLQTCQVCLLPCKLLSLLAGLLSSGLTEGTYVQLATCLLILDYNTLPVGLVDKAMISSLQNLSKRVLPSI
jgi:hypothetical protein